MILQRSRAPAQNVPPQPTPGASSAASAAPRAPGQPIAGPREAAAAEQPIIDRLIPGWQPARGVSQAAITLAGVLLLMLLVGAITSLTRRAIFFFRQREWKQPPPRIRAWKLGPEGMSYEMNQDAQFENERLRVLTERVDTIVSNVQIIGAQLPGLERKLQAAERGLSRRHDGVENAGS